MTLTFQYQGLSGNKKRQKDIGFKFRPGVRNERAEACRYACGCVAVLVLAMSTWTNPARLQPVLNRPRASLVAFCCGLGSVIYNTKPLTREEYLELVPAVHIFEWKIIFWKSIRYQI